jgi:hypothetical protein
MRCEQGNEILVRGDRMPRCSRGLRSDRNQQARRGHQRKHHHRDQPPHTDGDAAGHRSSALTWDGHYPVNPPAALAHARKRSRSVAAGVLLVNVTRATTVRIPGAGLTSAVNGALARFAMTRPPTEKTTRRIRRPLTVTRKLPVTQTLVPNRAIC